MAEGKFILYIRKFLRNPLLGRKQCTIEMVHPEMASVSKAQIKEKLVKQLKCKEDCITVQGLSSKFGGGRSSGIALIYDNIDHLKKYDSKTGLLRAKHITKPKQGRKAKKEIKGRANKVKGTKKSKVSAGKKK